jgi:hypothetical protein
MRGSMATAGLITVLRADTVLDWARAVHGARKSPDVL